MKRTIDKLDLPYEALEAAERLGDLVSITRRQRSWTQADLAAKAGIGLSTLADIEKGSPSVQMGHWLKALWAVDQAERLSRFADPQADREGVSLMVGKLPKRIRTPGGRGSS